MGNKAKSASQWLKQIGERLRQAREAREMGAGDVAAFVSKKLPKKNLGKSTYYQFEAGDHEPSFIHGVLICKCLGIRPEWLYDGEGPMDA